MTQSLTLGAPSLTGEDANLLVSALFADATYPLTVQVQNHMPRDVVFPEVSGLFLRHVANAAGSQMTVMIADHDQFQRLASSVAQIAELNGYAQALTLTAEGSAAGGAEGAAKTDPPALQPPPQTPQAPLGQEATTPKSQGKRGKSSGGQPDNAD